MLPIAKTTSRWVGGGKRVMATSTQFWSVADGTMFLTADGRRIQEWYVLNAEQQARVAEAFGLWDDVSAFTAIQVIDDDNLARDSMTIVTEYFLGIEYDRYWKNSLPNDWTRVALAQIDGGPTTPPRTDGGDETLGVNKADGAQDRYHEVYIDLDLEGRGRSSSAAKHLLSLCTNWVTRSWRCRPSLRPAATSTMMTQRRPP
jgi:hypothetical protein